MNEKVRKVYLIQDSSIMVCRDNGEIDCKLLSIDNITGFDVVNKGTVTILESIDVIADGIRSNIVYLYENPVTREEWYISRYFIAYRKNSHNPVIKAMFNGEIAVVAGIDSLIKYSRFLNGKTTIKIADRLGYLSLPNNPFLCCNSQHVIPIHLPIVI